MKFQRPIILTSILVALIGCNDNDKVKKPIPLEPSTPLVTLTGKVADGYIENALVCIDKNTNSLCDKDESQALTDAAGTFTIPSLTQETIDSFPLVAEITTDSTDGDSGDAFTAPFTLTAPAGYTFISPVTTMVQHYIGLGGEKDAAEQIITKQLDTNLNPNQDYIALENDETQAQSIRDDAKSLHSTAFIWTQLHIANLDNLTEADDDGQISQKEIMSLAVNKLKTILPAIKKAGLLHQLQGADFTPNNFEPDDDLRLASQIVPKNVMAQVQLAKAETKPHDLHAALINSSMSQISVDHTTSSPTIYYTKMNYNEKSQIMSETRHELHDGSFQRVLSTKTPFMVIKDGMLFHPNNTYKMKSANDDGSITFANTQVPDVTKTLQSTQVSLKSLSTATPFLTTPLHHEIVRNLKPDIEFTPNASGVTLQEIADTTILKQTIQLKCLNPEGVERCFDYLTYRHNGTIKIGSVLGESEFDTTLFSATPSMGDLTSLKGPIIAVNQEEFIIAEAIRSSSTMTSGTVNYYQIAYTQDDAGQAVETSDFIATSTWETPDSPFLQIKLDIPKVVIAFDKSGITANTTYIMTHNDQTLIAPEYNGSSDSSSPIMMFDDATKDHILSNMDTSEGSTADKNSHLSIALKRCTSGDSKNIHISELFELPIPTETISLNTYIYTYGLCAAKTSNLNPFLVPGDINFAGKTLTGFDETGEWDEIYTFTSATEATYTFKLNKIPHTEYFTWQSLNNDGFSSVLLSQSTSEPNKYIDISVIQRQDDILSTKIFMRSSDWNNSSDSSDSDNSVRGLVDSKLYTLSSNEPENN